MTDSGASLVDALNRECNCTVTDIPTLAARVDEHMRASGSTASIIDTHPNLFSAVPVFLDVAHAREMQKIVSAIHAVVRLPEYRHIASRQAPDIARFDYATPGVFLGFDFHVSAAGPKLIEINTNAGGALLNIAARSAQRACCGSVGESSDLEQKIVDMFLHEWRLARGAQPLHSIAIVDDAPVEQYLFPEFLMIRKLFESRGIDAFVVDAADLLVDGDKIVGLGRPIDLIYNRLTDFYFEDDCHMAIRAAYERDLAVVTPHPRAHALYSSKRNLILLSAPDELQKLGVPQEAIDVLTAGVPRTLRVAGNEAAWWAERRRWFFKPANGFGSRGTYRGDKITRRAFAEMMTGDYVAQALTPPSERLRGSGQDRGEFKIDFRCYVYADEVQLMAARLYQGQTTNFRTAGGGFAPVYVMG